MRHFSPEAVDCKVRANSFSFRFSMVQTLVCPVSETLYDDFLGLLSLSRNSELKPIVLRAVRCDSLA